MSISKRLRFEVFRRDGYACVYCGRRAPSVILEADHKVPRCRGGPDTLENLAAACWDCNRGKGPIDPDSGEAAQKREYDQDRWQSYHFSDGEDGEDWIDTLPRWMLPEGPPRYRLRLTTQEILSIAATLPSPTGRPEFDEEPF